MARPRLLEEDQIDQVVDDYQSGIKLREIEERHGITRSQLYYALQLRQVSPQRVKVATRLDDGNPETMRRLYEVLEAQDQRLQLFEQLVECLVDILGPGAAANAVAADPKLVELLADLTD